MNFKVFEILDWYDGGPELFVLTDLNWNLYLGYYYETVAGEIPHESFLVVSVDFPEMAKVKYNSLPVLDCFKRSSDRHYYIMTTTSKTVSFEFIPVHKISANMLPPKSYVLEPNVPFY